MRVLAIGSAASAFLTFMLFGAASVQANVIYDNGGMDLADLFFSDSGFGFQRFDDFNISGSGTVVLGDVHWWGAYSAFPDTSMDPADPDDFTIQIWSDSGGSPNALVYDLSFGPVDQYACQADAFRSAIRSGQPAPTPLDDAIANMAVIDAVFASAASDAWCAV